MAFTAILRGCKQTVAMAGKGTDNRSPGVFWGAVLPPFPLPQLKAQHPGGGVGCPIFEWPRFPTLPATLHTKKILSSTICLYHGPPCAITTCTLDQWLAKSDLVLLPISLHQPCTRLCGSKVKRDNTCSCLANIIVKAVSPHLDTP